MEILQCEAAVEKALKSSRVQQLMAAINKHLSGTTGPSTVALKCVHCRNDGAEGNARAFFSAPPPTVFFCMNRLQNEEEVEEVLVHELIHAYDYTARGMDFEIGEKLACSEVRSAREAECFEKAESLCKSTEFFALKDACKWWNRRCVKSTATRATESIFPDEAGKLVDKVFDECYMDHSPFENSA